MPAAVVQDTGRAVKLCGTELVDPGPRLLRAGPLSIELVDGVLRYLRFGGVEVLRAVAFLVRDENWGTLAPGRQWPHNCARRRDL